MNTSNLSELAKASDNILTMISYNEFILLAENECLDR